MKVTVKEYKDQVVSLTARNKELVDYSKTMKMQLTQIEQEQNEVDHS